jgi:ABC-2 type transport system permease protein
MFSIIKREIIRLLRDRAGLVMLTVFPVAMVFILGTSLQDLDASEIKINPIKIYAVNEITEPASLAAVDLFLTGINDSAEADVITLTDFAEAKKFAESDGSALLFKPSAEKPFEPFEIEFFGGGNDSVQQRALYSILEGFTAQYGAISAVAAENPAALVNLNTLIQQTGETELVQQTDFGYNRSMIDYYAVACCVMMLFMSGSTGFAMEFFESKRNGTLRRVVMSPKNRVSVYIQTLFGNLPSTMLTILFVMVCSALMFGAHYTSTWWGNLLLGVMFTVMNMAFAALLSIISMLTKFNPAILFQAAVFFMLFFSGSYSQQIHIDGVSEFLPPWIVTNAALRLTVFGQVENCLIVIAVATGCFAVFSIIGALLFDNKKVVSV